MYRTTPESSGREIEMVDPAGTGNLVLPRPEVLTAEQLLAGGPVSVLATPTQDPVPSRVPDGDHGAAPGGPAEASPKRSTEYVRVPSAPRLPKDVAQIWHYTDAGGVIGILTSDTLRASSLSSMNDSAEYQYGRGLLEQLLVEVGRSKNLHSDQKYFLQQIVALSDELSSRPGLFVLCASEAPHSLSQWRSYGQGQGHAVVLNPEAPLAILGSGNANYTIDTVQTAWRRVMYEPAEQADLIFRTLGFLAHSCTPGQREVSQEVEVDRSHAMVIVHALAHCKEPSFVEEREVRVVVAAPELSDIRFRPGAVGVVPYLEITGAEGNARLRADSRRPLPVEMVVVGPFAGREASAGGVITLLRSTRYGKSASVAIDNSTLR